MPFSTTSMVTSNDSLDHLPLGFVANTLFVLVHLCIVFDIVWGRTFSFSIFGQYNIPLCLLWGTLNIMMLLIFLNPTSKSLVECGEAPLVVLTYFSYVDTTKTISVLIQGNPYSCVNTLVLITSKMSTKSIESKSSYVVVV
jgi:hypothetical protein